MLTLELGLIISVQLSMTVDKSLRITAATLTTIVVTDHSVWCKLKVTSVREKKASGSFAQSAPAFVVATLQLLQGKP